MSLKSFKNISSFLQWTGYFFCNETGTWTFSLSSDDGSFLWMGDTAKTGTFTAATSMRNEYRLFFLFFYKNHFIVVIILSAIKKIDFHESGFYKNLGM